MNMSELKSMDQPCAARRMCCSSPMRSGPTGQEVEGVGQHVEHGLPLGIHAGSAYRHPQTSVGWTSWYLEEYAANQQGFQSTLASLMTEGARVVEWGDGVGRFARLRATAGLHRRSP